LKQYQILASPQRMKHFDVTLPELINASKEASVNVSGGFMSEFGNEYVIRGIGRTNSLEEVGKTVVKFTPNNRVTINDVAEIKIGSATKIGDGSLRGETAVILTVMKRPNTNTLELTET